MAELVLELAETVAGVGVKTSYGETIDIDGTKVVPVALGYYGFGAGSGSDQKGDQGSGGGGGAASIPLGAYVGRRGGEVRFEPNLIGVLLVVTPLVLVATPLVWATGKALRTVIRALKR
jgi:hypothetical protein